MIREYIIREIVAAKDYRDSDDRPMYTTVFGFMFSSEIEYVKSYLGLTIKPISSGYNLIILNS